MGSIYVINKKKINQNRVTDNFYEIMIKRTREMLKYFLENRKNEENIN